jgi:hypothetical protein
MSEFDDITYEEFIPELSSDPVNVMTEDSWMLRDEHPGVPIGLLLSLTHTKMIYKFSYKTLSGKIVRIRME